jgi:hypothetical protein
MTDIEIDLFTYYGQRELSFCPNHFTICTTPITPESLNWVISKLKGRYTLLVLQDSLFQDVNEYKKVAFEDSKEAMFYELTWS